MDHILIEHDAWEHYIHSISQMIAAALLCWDHVVTLGVEIEYIWIRPKSRSSIIFLAFRYLTLTSTLSMLVLSSRPILEPKSCSAFALSRQVVIFVSQTAVAGILTIRIYALYSADRRILWLSGVMIIIAAGLSAYALSLRDQVNYPLQFGCHSGVLHQESLRIAGLWIILFVYDAILFALTASRTYRVWRETSSGRLYLGVVDRPSLVSLFFRDGVMYFVVMALVTLANILTFYFGGPFIRGGLSSFASCTSATMLCRLMLNLHETASAGLTTPPTLESWKVRTGSGDEDSDAEAAVVMSQQLEMKIPIINGA